ncbi:MAG: NeuD/PglB/VioB family sugar acetyltransferase [Acidobacteriota bacterium]|nr:NeuD/PglB/VioB family sugar acetyltransferase [Acidobacteriota bacterium]
MNKLIIVGAGGFGRETLQWALQSKENDVKWSVAGFIDDELDKLNGFDCSYTILGRILDWQPKPNERFVVAIGPPKTKKAIAARLAGEGAIFENIIHKTVTLATTAKLGCGIILCPNVVVSDNAVIDDHVGINISSSVGHDACVGAYATISSYCDITAGVSLGEGTFLGSSVCIVPQRKIGSNAYICAGSAVMNHVQPDTRVMGVPAKKFEIKTS